MTTINIYDDLNSDMTELEIRLDDITDSELILLLLDYVKVNEGINSVNRSEVLDRIAQAIG